MNKAEEEYLNPGLYTNSDDPKVIEYAKRVTEKGKSLKEKMIQLFYAVRDDFRYNPYRVILKPYALKASYLLTKDYGYCVEKSNLFAACARVLGLPSRLGFANVRNHLATGRLVEVYLRNDLLVFHGFAEIFLNGRWIKVTPVFDQGLCDKMGVQSMAFDGENDAVFQQSDKEGKPFMDYIDDHGTFADVPFDKFVSELSAHYPHLFHKQIRNEKFHFEF